MYKIFNIFIFSILIKIGQSDFVKCIAQCVDLSDCYEAKMFLKDNGTVPQICGFSGTEPKVCCAEQDENTLFDIHYGGLRKADKKCKELNPPIIYRHIKRLPSTFGVSKPYGGFRVTEYYQFRYMAAVGYGNINSPIYRCGGFLLEKNIVITAAHCSEINGEPPIAVRIGSYPLSTNHTKAIRIAKIISHPKYQPQTYLNDIAIIILAENSKEDPACLFTQRVNLRHDNQTIALGFGTTSFGGPFSDQLIKVYMSIKDNSVCEKEFEDQPIVKSQLCVLGETRIFENKTSAVQDTCQGDSGGPLVLGRNDNYVVGIVSYGRGCGTEAPGIYTHVASYLDWIELVLKQEENLNGIHKCSKMDEPYITVRTCNKNADIMHILCSEIAKVGSQYHRRFDSMVALGYGDLEDPDYRCSGVLIDHNVIITAAQCAKYNGKPPIVALIGNTRWKTNLIQVVKVILHPKYDYQSYLNDIAIVFLAENSNIKPTCIWSSSLANNTNTEAYAISLGSTYFEEPPLTHLTHIKLRILDKNFCVNQYQEKSIHDSQLCAEAEGVDYLGEDTYEGDSGGPIYLDKYPSYVIGIVSYGQSPGRYTNITSYLDWIESVVWPEGTQEERVYVS